MNNDENAVEITLGRIPMRVPIIVDSQTTQRIAKQVNERITKIEQESNRGDTYEFALLTALTFAAELEQAQRTHHEEVKELVRTKEHEERELLLALSKINESIRAIVREIE